MNNNLHKTQIDFVSLKLDAEEALNLNWSHLVDHPALRNQYTLGEKTSPYAKNFSLYAKSSGEVIISLSIPYFLYGHNYHTVEQEELMDFYLKIKMLLGIDLAHSEIIELEYGGFQDSETAPKEFLKKILRMHNYDLIYSKPYMKMFGDEKQGICFKIYDAIENALQKRTYLPERFPKDNILKFELKVKKPEKIFKKKLTFGELLGEPSQNSLLNKFRKLLTEVRSRLVLPYGKKAEPITYDLLHIIYAGLKNMENYHPEPVSVFKDLMGIIDESPLSPSQKSKRRKAIQQLEKEYDFLPF